METALSAQNVAAGTTVMHLAPHLALPVGRLALVAARGVTMVPTVWSGAHHVLLKRKLKRVPPPTRMPPSRWQTPPAKGGVVRDTEPRSVPANAEALLRSGAGRSGAPAAAAHRGTARQPRRSAGLSAGPQREPPAANQRLPTAQAGPPIAPPQTPATLAQTPAAAAAPPAA